MSQCVQFNRELFFAFDTNEHFSLLSILDEHFPLLLASGSSLVLSILSLGAGNYFDVQ